MSEAKVVNSTCPFCPRKCRRDNLPRHIRNAHPQASVVGTDVGHIKIFNNPSIMKFKFVAFCFDCCRMIQNSNQDEARMIRICEAHVCRSARSDKGVTKSAAKPATAVKSADIPTLTVHEVEVEVEDVARAVPAAKRFKRCVWTKETLEKVIKEYEDVSDDEDDERTFITKFSEYISDTIDDAEAARANQTLAEDRLDAAVRSERKAVSALKDLQVSYDIIYAECQKMKAEMEA